MKRKGVASRELGVARNARLSWRCDRTTSSRLPTRDSRLHAVRFAPMALLTPARLRQGFVLFLLISVIAYAAVLYYGNDTAGFIASLSRLRWRWVVVGAALASMDWFGGGTRLWVLARVVH